MKKIGIILLMLLTFGMASCKDNTKESKAIEEFVNQVEKATSYELDGKMDVTKNDSTVSFSMNVCYSGPSCYKVTYVNNANNSRQILLKNADGVYVLSPELNKEFKFESTWPLNSSHIYILNKVVADLKDDAEKTVKTEGDYYVITSKISHKVRTDLVSQSIYLSTSDYSLCYITYNTETSSPMKFSVDSLKYNVTFKSNAFNVDAIMESESALIGEGSTEKVSEILFGDVFEGVVLSASNTGEDYTVLSYSGEKNYTIIYQTVIESSVSTVERIFDDFVMLDETIGYISSNSLTFYRGDKEFKIISSELTLQEMVEIANSLVIQ